MFIAWGSFAFGAVFGVLGLIALVAIIEIMRR